MSRSRTELIVVRASETIPTDDSIGLRQRFIYDKERGYFDCCDHFVIRRTGVVEQSKRPLADAAMRLGELGKVSVAVLLIGRDGNYTPEQLKALCELVEELQGVYPEAILDTSRIERQEDITTNT